MAGSTIVVEIKIAFRCQKRSSSCRSQGPQTTNMMLPKSCWRSLNKIELYVSRKKTTNPLHAEAPQRQRAELGSEEGCLANLKFLHD